MLFFWRFVEFLGSDNESSDVHVVVFCLARKQSLSNPGTAELAGLSAHQSAGCSRSTRTSAFTHFRVSACEVYEFYPGATQREAGRPSDSSHNGWPLIWLQRRATARDEGSRKFSVHA